MLIQLSVKDFALIDRIDIEFNPHLNVLTGETGAGKSIIIDAVSLLLGARAQSEFIRDGKEKAIVEGTFSVPENHPLEKALAEYGYEQDADGLLILTREISNTGKNICRINGRIVTLGIFKEIGNHLVNIYGQHDFQTLSNSEKHALILDNMGDDNIKALLNQVFQTYQEWKKHENQFKNLSKKNVDKAQRLEFIKFQIDEIAKLNINKDEDEEIARELSVLENWEKILNKTQDSYQLLYGTNSVYDQLSKVIKYINEVSEYDQQLSDLVNNLDNIVYQIEDSARTLADYGQDFSYDPQRKQFLQERKYAIDKLKKKYGGTLKDILDFKNSLETELLNLENSDVELEKARTKALHWEKEYIKIAEELSDLRKKQAVKLEKAISEQLKELAMPHTIFKVKFEKIEKTSQGIDKIEFLISPNPGESLKPLAKIASGGEMSRIMLAFKVILAGTDTINTFIFDEIDSGIGGHVVRTVADKLYEVASNQQVICVTHSPHIASLAHSHFKIAKNIKNKKTSTYIINLNENLRINELARMLGNDDNITLNHAQELRNKALLK